MQFVALICAGGSCRHAERALPNFPRAARARSLAERGGGEGEGVEESFCAPTKRAGGLRNYAAAEADNARRALNSALGERR